MIDRLTVEFARLPGIGPKTATRLVHHLMKGSKEDARRLARAVNARVARVGSVSVSPRTEKPIPASQ